MNVYVLLFSLVSFVLDSVLSNVELSDQYRLVERLGNQRKRKFGELYLAEDKGTLERVVLKVVHLDSNDTLSSTRLKAEATFTFDHPGLPKTLRFIETDSELLLVRSYANGIQLDSYWATLKRRKKLSFLLELLKKLNPIFHYLKNEQIVHCDIKPSNILIEEMDSTFNVHLIDFGLALRENEIELNQSRKLLFPLGYAAPELLLNELDLVDHRTDMYALGIVIWRLYTGNLPLVHPNPSIFTNLQLTHPLPEHSEISRRLHRILLKMTNKHQFKLPPNKMKSQEVRVALAKAIAQRYSDFNEIIPEVEVLSKRKFWG